MLLGLGLQPEWENQEMRTKFWMGDLCQSIHLVDQDGDVS